MNSNLQDKLSRFEATPPPGVWDKVARALDEDCSFSKKIYDYEELPKTNLWQRIEASLDSEAAKVIPISRLRRPVRYIAAAAAIIAVVVTGAYFLIKRDNGLNTISTAGQISAPFNKQKNLSAVEAEDSNHPLTHSHQDISYQPLASDDVAFTREGQFATSVAKRALATVPIEHNTNGFILKEDFIPGQVNQQALFDFSSENDHMVYSDGNGKAIKLPKRLFDLVNCSAGDVSCEERIQRLQQKLSTNITNADFAGLLDMIRQLQ